MKVTFENIDAKDVVVQGAVLQRYEVLGRLSPKGGHGHTENF